MSFYNGALQLQPAFQRFNPRQIWSHMDDVKNRLKQSSLKIAFSRFSMPLLPNVVEPLQTTVTETTPTAVPTHRGVPVRELRGGRAPEEPGRSAGGQAR